MTIPAGSTQAIGGVMRFLWDLLTRFAKTTGFLIILASLVCTAALFQQRQPVIEAVRYRESALLTERLRKLAELYALSQRAVLEFRGGVEFPSQYSAALVTPLFPSRFDSLKSFDEADAQLSRMGHGRESLKRSVLDRFDANASEIQEKLHTHAASLTPPVPPVPLQSLPPVSPFAAIYGEEVGGSRTTARKRSLEEAKEFLGTLLLSAENAENRKKLEDSIAELNSLTRLFPDLPPSPAAARVEDREITDAEKVAERLGRIRASVREAVASSWALDEMYDRTLETLEQERRNFVESDVRVRRASEELHLSMAVTLGSGMLLGVFFLLIGDWTQKASTEVIEYWAELFPDFNASPDDVYGAVKSAVLERQVPGLECTREFWHEGGAVSAKREYLRFARERTCFEICACPFGTGFFLSYRTSIKPLIVDPLGILLLLFSGALIFGALVAAFGLVWGGAILLLSLSLLAFALRTAIARGLGDLDRVFVRTPLIGPLYELFLRPVTYYRIDSQEMYLRAVRSAVEESFRSIFGQESINMTPTTVEPPVSKRLDRHSLG
jgi:hypothetical protein